MEISSTHHAKEHVRTDETLLHNLGDNQMYSIANASRVRRVPDEILPNQPNASFN